MAILVYDITDSSSFQKLQDLFIPLLKGAGQSCLTVVVGAKSDLLGEKSRQVTKQQGLALAEQQHLKQLERAKTGGASTFLSSVIGKKSFFETSSKTGENVSELFNYIEEIVQSQTKVFKPHPDVITVEKKMPVKESPKGCCK